MMWPAPSSPEPPEPIAVPGPLIRLPLWKMSTLLLGAPKLVLLGAAGLAILKFPHEYRGKIASEFWAAVSLYTGVAVGMVFLWQYRPRPAAGWRSLVNISRGIRLATTGVLAVGFARAFHFKTSAPFFWWSIAISTVLVMFTDVLIVNKALGGEIGLVPDDVA